MLLWRLVFGAGMGWQDVMIMDEDEILEANAALDWYIQEQKKGARK